MAAWWRSHLSTLGEGKDTRKRVSAPLNDEASEPGEVKSPLRISTPESRAAGETLSGLLEEMISSDGGIRLSRRMESSTREPRLPVVPVRTNIVCVDFR